MAVKPRTTMATPLLYLCLASIPVVHTDEQQYRRYAGYQVLRVHPRDAADHQAVQALLSQQCSLYQEPHGALDHPVDILCAPDYQPAACGGLNVSVLIEDLGHLIQQERQRRVKRQASTTMTWTDYQRYDTIISWMQATAAANPSFTSLINMGSSVEKRSLLVMKIGLSPLGTKTRAIWIDGGIHAREWIAVSTVSYLLQKLVTTFQSDTTSNCTLAGVKSVDWYVAPLINPDGYEYTFTSDRLWRKNRQPAPAGSSCAGVDLNRNWNVTGYGVGASTNPCSDVYRGPFAMSEPETRAVAQTILQYSNNIRIYLTFHSYGLNILCSWGYTSSKPVDSAKLTMLAKKAKNGVQCVNAVRNYTIESGNTLYPAGGASDDWAKIVAKIPYSYTLELPDDGSQHGFLLPPSYIVPVGEEWWQAVLNMAPEAARHPLGPDPSLLG